jgi:hypothetical protein
MLTILKNIILITYFINVLLFNVKPAFACWFDMEVDCVADLLEQRRGKYPDVVYRTIQKECNTFTCL